MTNEFKIERKASDIIQPRSLEEARQAIKEKRDLSGANLQGFDFENLNASGAILRKTNLTGSALTHGLLMNPNFYRSTAHRTNFQHTVMLGPDLVRAEFLDADLSDSALIGADAQEALFINANLRNAGLVGGDYSNTNFSGANLSNAWLAGIKVTGADFSGVDTTGAKAYGIDWSTAKVPPAILPAPVIKLPTWAWAALAGSLVGLLGVLVYSLSRRQQKSTA